VFGHEDDPEAVRILEGQPVLGPVRVGGSNWIDTQSRRHRLHRRIVAEVEHQERFRMRRRGAVATAGGEFKVRACLDSLSVRAKRGAS
jgi:hypothetical protein